MVRGPFTLAKGVLVGLVVCACSATANTVPKAPHLVYQVARGASVEITLRGYDPDGGKLTARVVSLPTSGHLYQLTQVYNQYGYEPRYENPATRILSASTVVTGKKARVIYEAPNTPTPNGKWTTFKYVVTDSQGAVSAEGIVQIVPTGASKVLVGSDFSRDVDGWGIRTSGGGPAMTLAHERTSYGALNYFVYATDQQVKIDTTTGDDTSIWFFNAPSKYLGAHASAYGGKLEFSLGAFAGNFDGSTGLNTRRDVAVLECATCNLGKGMRFVARNLRFDGTTQKFSLTLKETGGWLKDPRNTLKTWTTPSQCEMVDMLHSLSAVRILGDFTRWYESVGLDNVSITAGSRTGPPPKCLCTHPGTQC
jgi:hypothetical protein